MSDLSDLRDILASAHGNMAGLISKTVTFYDRANAAISAWSNLTAVVIDDDKKKIELFGALLGPQDRMIEVARQGTFDGTRPSGSAPLLVPHLYKISYAGQIYEVVGIKTDSTETNAASVEYPAVFIFACKHLGLGVGEMAT